MNKLESINNFTPTVQSENNFIRLKAYKFNDSNETKLPLFFLHGLFASKSFLEPIANQEKLNSRRQAFLVDLRNHGLSDHHETMTYSQMADDVHRLIKEELKIKTKVTLVGQSMGGKIALVLALKYPDLIDGIFIIDTAPVSFVKDPMFQGIVASVNAIADVNIEQIPKEEILEFLKKMFGEFMGNLLSKSIDYEIGGKPQWRLNREAIRKNIEDLAGWQDQDIKCNVPIRVLNGELSIKFDIKDFQRYFPQMKSNDLRIIQGAGHNINDDKPEETVKELVEFIDELDANKFS